MTDFRTLALEYVLSDAPDQQKKSAVKAASGRLETRPPYFSLSEWSRQLPGRAGIDVLCSYPV